MSGYVTPYGRSEELAHQNERLVRALRRERRALAAERERLQAVRDLLAAHETPHGSEARIPAHRIRRALGDDA